MEDEEEVGNASAEAKLGPEDREVKQEEAEEE